MALSAQSSEKFALLIEARVIAAKISYMEAILEFCEKRSLEPESVVPLMNDKIKSALALEAQRLHFIPKTSSLPL